MSGQDEMIKRLIIRRTIIFVGCLSHKMRLPDCSLELRFRARKIISDGSMERLGTIRTFIQVPLILLSCAMLQGKVEWMSIHTAAEKYLEFSGLIVHLSKPTLVIFVGFPLPGFGDCVAMDTSSTAGLWMNFDCNSKLPVACIRDSAYIPPLICYKLTANAKYIYIFRDDKPRRQLYLLCRTLGGGHTGILDMTPKNYTFFRSPHPDSLTTHPRLANSS